MFFDKSLNAIYFGSTEAARILKSHRTEPEFGDLGVTFDMNMSRFMLIASITKETIRTDP
jgi:hypothetical protein